MLGGPSLHLQLQTCAYCVSCSPFHSLLGGVSDHFSPMSTHELTLSHRKADQQGMHPQRLKGSSYLQDGNILTTYMRA